MLDISLSIYVLATGIMVCAAYALVMSMLQRTVNLLWTRGEAVLLLAASGIAIASAYKYIFGVSTLYTLAVALLLLTLLGSLCVVVFHRFAMDTATEYPQNHFMTIKSCSYALLALSLLHILVLFAAIAGF